MTVEQPKGAALSVPWLSPQTSCSVALLLPRLLGVGWWPGAAWDRRRCCPGFVSVGPSCLLIPFGHHFPRGALAASVRAAAGRQPPLAHVGIERRRALVPRHVPQDTARQPSSYHSFHSHGLAASTLANQPIDDCFRPSVGLITAERASVSVG